MTAPDFSAALNPQQLEAVTSGRGRALVIAGAGSGKTRTLTYRVAWLLSQGVPARAILLLTFTNKAAREMLDRVAGLSPRGAGEIWGGTFHAIGNRILRAHAQRLGFQPGFSILDREDSEEMVAAAIADTGAGGPQARFPKPAVLAEIFSLAANSARGLDEILVSRFGHLVPFRDGIARVAAAYDARKRDSNAMDFDDLLVKTIELFDGHPDVEERYQEQFQHVLVDEYQDTNLPQAEMVERFSARHGNAMVVGDDAQSIYSWRGAHFENILHFPDRHPAAAVFRIETNYRSVPQVLDLANAAILANARQLPKTLAPARPAHAARPVLAAHDTSAGQAAFVADRIGELLGEGTPACEIAVLYRAHFHSMEIQIELTRRQIPFAITSGLRFFEQAHVKDIAAFMRFAVNPRDQAAFSRMARFLPGVGKKTVPKLWERVSAALSGRREFRALDAITVPAKAAKDWRQLVHTLDELAPGGNPSPPAAMIEAALFAMYEDFMKATFVNYEHRRDDLDTLAGFARQFESAEDFLAQISLLAGAEAAEAAAAGDTRDKITLSTVHQAKGLEWRAVFLVWLTEGMFPHARAAESPGGIEEERRLFYVAITRCKDELVLNYPAIRSGGGSGDILQRPSRFLAELPADLYDSRVPAMPVRACAARGQPWTL